MTTVPRKNRYSRFFSLRIRLVSDFLHHHIWRSSALHEPGLRGRVYAILRILSIILNGLSNNRLLIRSAALTFYSLIALGPVIAIAFMISGYILERNATNMGEASLNRAPQFITPPVAQLARISQTDSDAEAPVDRDPAPSPSPTTSPEQNSRGARKF